MHVFTINQLTFQGNDNIQLIGFSTITSALVQKYLPESTAMAKEYMNQKSKGLQATTKKENNTKQDTEADFNPPQVEEAEVELFIGATIAQQSDGTIYTNQTGNFPVRSCHEKQCMFVA